MPLKKINCLLLLSPVGKLCQLLVSDGDEEVSERSFLTLAVADPRVSFETKILNEEFLILYYQVFLPP